MSGCFEQSAAVLVLQLRLFPWIGKALYQSFDQRLCVNDSADFGNTNLTVISAFHHWCSIEHALNRLAQPLGELHGNLHGGIKQQQDDSSPRSAQAKSVSRANSFW